MLSRINTKETGFLAVSAVCNEVFAKTRLLRKESVWGCKIESRSEVSAIVPELFDAVELLVISFPVASE
ncbi:hypothetical protein [Microcoleus sp. N9_A1]|uniref:hypothetical protein n=1 Tax=Microcoleus sp. N9_A1 TaxID=3055380 RepID=UPI002FD48DEC